MYLSQKSGNKENLKAPALPETTDRKKIAFHTLGCKLNFAETSTIAKSFSPELFERVPSSTRADIYVINTCSVTDAADRKCRQAIKKFINMSPGAFIAVVGCYAQLSPGEVSSIPGVDLILGTNEKFDIPGYITSLEKKSEAEVHSCDLAPTDRFFHSGSTGDRTRSFLKIQDGCDYKCSYCTIPAARGKSRNPSVASVVAEAEKIASAGVKEIVLTGVNIGDFGRSTGESFYDLLKELVRVAGIERYRISSIEPNLLTSEIVTLAAENKKIMPHFHIPLQSGCDRILGLMRRRYNRKIFSEKVDLISRMIPSAGIGADVITGFPGETGAEFLDTFTFLESMPISYLHVFTFSARPGTIAANLPGKIKHAEMEARSRKLISLSVRRQEAFCHQNAGTETEVLFEQARISGMITGFTPNYIKVEHPWNSKLAGNIERVKLKGIAADGRMTVELTNQA
jgi:threonylcarbamoyladenosine tRNA methylthiotransferase MtaB